jgi:S1-C subfamily serine protease
MSTESAGIRSLQSFSDAVVALAEGVSPSVVSVSGGRRGFGTGVVWSEDGYIVTNSHVVREGAEVGQFVIAVANALGGEPSVTSGIITSSKRSMRAWGGQFFEDVVLSDAQVNPGYSGGPLVDALGNMVALNSAFAFSRAISVPVNTVKKVAEKLKRDGKVKHAYLGVVLDPIALPEEVEGQEYGLMVLSVSKDSPAKAAGLAMGDVVLEFGGNKVSSYGELRKLLSESAIGSRAKISVLRGGKMSELEVVPAEG